MQICVKTSAGKSITLKVEPTDYIEDIKAKIEDQEGIPTYEQRLTIENKELEDEKTLKDYNIENDNIINLILPSLHDGDPPKKKKLWIDTDCGIDDSTAILLCLASEEFEVIGISCIGGNTLIKNVLHNVCRTLKVWGHGAEKIPVYAGANVPLVEPSHPASHVHGKDGLSDFDDSHYHFDPIDNIQKESGINALIKAAQTIPGLHLLTLGPLTNLAIALRLNPNAIKKIYRLCIMGGAEDGKGNATKYSEFNIYADPEAAKIVFSSFPQKKIILSSWTVTLKNRLKVEDAKFLTLREETIMYHWMKDIWAQMHRFNPKGDLTTADPIAAFIFCIPHAIKESCRMKIDVILSGERRAETTAHEDPNGVLVVKDIDYPLYIQKLNEMCSDH